MNNVTLSKLNVVADLGTVDRPMGGIQVVVTAAGARSRVTLLILRKDGSVRFDAHFARHEAADLIELLQAALGKL